MEISLLLKCIGICRKSMSCQLTQRLSQFSLTWHVKISKTEFLWHFSRSEAKEFAEPSERKLNFSQGRWKMEEKAERLDMVESEIGFFHPQGARRCLLSIFFPILSAFEFFQMLENPYIDEKVKRKLFSFHPSPPLIVVLFELRIKDAFNNSAKRLCDLTEEAALKCSNLENVVQMKRSTKYRKFAKLLNSAWKTILLLCHFGRCWSFWVVCVWGPHQDIFSSANMRGSVGTKSNKNFHLCNLIINVKYSRQDSSVEVAVAANLQSSLGRLNGKVLKATTETKNLQPFYTTLYRVVMNLKWSSQNEIQSEIYSMPWTSQGNVSTFSSLQLNEAIQM